jgi:hypothetical protein
MESLFSFPVGLLHPLQHAGYPGALPFADNLEVNERCASVGIDSTLNSVLDTWPRTVPNLLYPLSARLRRPRCSLATVGRIKDNSMN